MRGKPQRVKKMLFLGPYALSSTVERQAEAWRSRISELLDEEFSAEMVDQPFDVETDLEAKGYWVRPVAKQEEYSPVQPSIAQYSPVQPI